MNACITGDCRQTLRDLIAKGVKVQMLNSGTVQFLAAHIKRVTESDILIGKRQIWNLPRSAARIRKVTEAGDFCFMFTPFGLKMAQSKDRLGVLFFDSKVWENRFKNLSSFLVGGLVTEQWSTISRVCLFLIIPPSERFADKSNCGFINHSNLYPCVISRSGSTLASIALVFLDSDVPFPVNDPCDVSQISISHVSSQYVVLVIIQQKGGGFKVWLGQIRVLREIVEEHCGVLFRKGSRYKCASRLRHTGDWGLRDYGTATWEGGRGECDHVQSRSLKRDTNGGLPPAGEGTRGTQSSTASSTMTYRDQCPRCGAVRIDSQLGLEQTPEEYVANMVEVFRLVREVLKDDGTLWCNMGDTYNSPNTHSGKADKVDWGIQRVLDAGANHGGTTTTLKPKDLCGIPWRLALGLQADGWYLRSDIIWHKPNPMPESVTDRPTKSHEYMFLLSKSARYYYDQEAVREPLTEASINRDKSPRGRRQNGGGSDISMQGIQYTAELGDMKCNPSGRNLRSVWTIATAPYSEAHFATFPPALITPCIKAGSRVGDTVLDPFFGSGTTGQVCEQLGRKWIGCELSEQYAALWKKRTAQGGLGI
jgi:DNA modification methylase